MQIDWALGFGVTMAAVLAALGGLLALAALQARMTPTRSILFSEQTDETSFLFDGEILIDATPGGRALLALGSISGGPWSRLLTYIVPRFPEFETRLAVLPGNGQMLLSMPDGDQNALMLRAELRGGLTRITLLDPDAGGRTAGFDPMTQRVMEEELGQMRATLSQAPFLIWRENAVGDVIWANASYLLHAATKLEPGQDLAWPLPRLFERTATMQGAIGQRQRLDQAGTGSHWFDLTGFAEGDGRLLFALPADAVVQAEGSLRDFMQTLTKTFAHLPIGLAIFDRQRQLALFNPALMDLSGLQPDFLSMRPTLFAFLDAMRDRNMIPEPKDYRGWRKQMTELEQAASSGLFEDTWSLPSGQTYRIIGRPHPNGALALMFEDISTEMSRTRRYRADLELGQAVIDAMADAIAVFSQSGILVMSNAAYAALWGHDPAAALGESGIATLCAHWRGLSAPTTIWADAESFVATLGERTRCGGEARLTDGRLVDCSFKPLQGGATLATFRLISPVRDHAPGFATARARKLA
ncbi:MAG: PAS-domain containing protein [Paracoccaceae bacterium]|nr:PAS-domain containing protein [Paracoccaceae bacterium]